MTPETLNRYNSKWHEEKKFFILDLLFIKYIYYTLLAIFIKKFFFRRFFNKKDESFQPFAVVFLCISAGWESYRTHRRPIRVRRGWGSYRGLPHGHLEVIYDSQPDYYALFFAIQIRVNPRIALRKSWGLPEGSNYLKQFPSLQVVKYRLYRSFL
jgi:hypothetical protein